MTSYALLSTLTTTEACISTPSTSHARQLGVKTSFSPLKPSAIPSSPPQTPQQPESAYPQTQIARLPPELLHLVFELVKSEVCAEYEAAPTEKEGSRKPDWMAWRAVTQVCQRWRRIALASSTLWREIKFRRVGLPWGLEMLRRARTAPLKIELGHAPGYQGFPTETDSLSFTTTLLSPEEGHARRLQTFTLFGVDMDAVAAMLFVAEDGAYEGLEDLQVETRWDDVQVSFEVIRRSMPRLRELRLYGPVITRPPAAPLECLTHLNLQHDSPAGSGKNGVTGLLLPEILRALPKLVDLQLTDVFPPKSLVDCMPPIELAKSCQSINLTTRWFADWAISFGRVLSHPTATREYALEDCEPAQLSDLLSSYAGTAAPKQPRQLGITIGHPAGSVTVSICYEPWDRNPPVDARVPRHAFSVTFGDHPELWDVVRDSLDLRAVEDIAFEDDSCCDGLGAGGESEDEKREAEGEGDGRNEGKGEGESEILRQLEADEDAMYRWKLFLGAPIKRVRVTGLSCKTLFSILSTPPCPCVPLPTCDHRPSFFPDLTELSIIESPERPGLLGPLPFALGPRLLHAVRARQKRFGGKIREVKVPDRFLYDAWVDEVLLEVGRVSNSRYRYF